MKFIKKFWHNYHFVLLVVIVWRAYLFAVGFLGFSLLTFKASFPYIDQHLIASTFPQWFWHWGNFDGVHYLDLATHGYHAQGLHVFFPMYPIIVSGLEKVIGNYFLAGFIVSHAAIVLAALLFYKFLKTSYSESVAKWAIVLLFAFPTSFFFGSLYTESLFFLLIVLSISTTGYVSAVVNFFAGLTRLVGVFLSLGSLWPKTKWKYFLISISGLIVLLLYSWYFYFSPLLIISDQANFQNARATTLSGLVTPFQVVFRYLKIFTTANPTHYDYLLAVLEFLAFGLGTVVLALLTWKRRFKAEWLAFGWLSLLLPTLSGTFSSMPRYLLIVFPLFIAFGQLKNRWLKLTILALSTMLLSVLTMLFVRGYFVS